MSRFIFRSIFFRWVIGGLVIFTPQLVKGQSDTIPFTEGDKETIEELKQGNRRLNRRLLNIREAMESFEQSARQSQDSLTEEILRLKSILTSQDKKITEQSDYIDTLRVQIANNQKIIEDYKTETEQIISWLWAVLLLLGLLIIGSGAFLTWQLRSKIISLEQHEEDIRQKNQDILWVIKRYGKKRSNFMRKLIKKRGLEKKAKKSN